MKIKKILAMLLISIMTLALVACGDDKDKDDDSSEKGSKKPISGIFGGGDDEDDETVDDEKDTTEKSDKETTKKPEKETTKKPEKETTTESEEETTKKPVDEDETTKKTDSEYKPGEFNTSATIEETVIVDKDGVKITATSMKVDKYNVSINYTFENNTDKELKFQSGSTSGEGANAVNGYMVNSGYISETLEAGTKKDVTIKFSVSELKLYGISDVAELLLGYRVLDDDYNVITAGVTTVNTSLIDAYDKTINTYMSYVDSGAFAKDNNLKIDYITDKVVYSSEGLKILSVMVASDDDETAIVFEIENTSSKVVSSRLEDIYVNDLYVYDALGTTYMYPNTKIVFSLPIDYFDAIDYFSDALEMDKIGKIDFTFKGSALDYSTVGETKDVSILVNEADNKLNAEGTEIYNKNGIRVVKKAIMMNDDTYNDLVFLLIVENNSDGTITVEDEYDSFKVNGKEIDAYIDEAKLKPGMKFAMFGEIFDDDLEEIEVKSISDITGLEFTIVIEGEDRKEIDNSVIKFTVE